MQRHKRDLLFVSETSVMLQAMFLHVTSLFKKKKCKGKLWTVCHYTDTHPAHAEFLDSSELSWGNSLFKLTDSKEDLWSVCW